MIVRAEISVIGNEKLTISSVVCPAGSELREVLLASVQLVVRGLFDLLIVVVVMVLTLVACFVLGVFLAWVAAVLLVVWLIHSLEALVDKLLQKRDLNLWVKVVSGYHVA